jgi:hypothetical protein
MKTVYNNIPPAPVSTNKESTLQAFSVYSIQPLELSTSVYTAIKGFFTLRGFDTTAADSIAVIIISQSKKDGYNPMTILDTLRGLDNVEISALIAEILNYNRFKTSALGYTRQFIPNQEVLRNIVA